MSKYLTENMSFFTPRLHLIIGIILIIFISCTNQKPATTNTKILIAYAEQYAGDENEFIYFQTKKEINWFQDYIGIPFDRQKLQEIFKPVKGVNFDSLLININFKLWNKKLKNYHSITWDRDKFINIPFIKKSEIPGYYFGKSIPAPNDTLITVHKLSTPIVVGNVALLYYSRRTSLLNGSAGYLMFAKVDGSWQIVAKDIVVRTN